MTEEKKTGAGPMDLNALLGGGGLGMMMEVVKPMLDEARTYEADTRYALKTIFRLILLIMEKLEIPADKATQAMRKD